MDTFGYWCWFVSVLAGVISDGLSDLLGFTTFRNMLKWGSWYVTNELSYFSFFVLSSLLTSATISSASEKWLSSCSTVVSSS